MTKPYFHLLPAADFEALKKLGATWADIMAKYRQPAWCRYPDALSGMFGCWSLVGRKVTGEAYCEGCDCHIRPRGTK